MEHAPGVGDGYGDGFADVDVRRVDGARLPFVERGSGPAVVLVHGSLVDLRYWVRCGLLNALAVRHRVIAPSRRHNAPNPPEPGGDAYAAGTDAGDLIELIDALDLGPVRLLGHSYGAYAALLAALDRPDLVARLVLAEPPLMQWLPHLPGGEGRWERFDAGTWRPMRAAFESSRAAGLDAVARWAFGRPFEALDPVERQETAANAPEWAALLASRDPYPWVSFERVAALDRPALLLSGARNAGGFNDLVDARLAELLPDVRRATIAGAGHELFLDAPRAVAEVVAGFFAP